MKYITRKIGDKFHKPKIFDKFFGRKISEQVPAGEELIAVPSVNIADRNNHYDVSVALPGLEKKDVNIQVDNGQLIISSEKDYRNEEKNDNWIRQEYGYASFYRTFDIPEDGNADKIEAKMKNGVLKIKLPRIEGKKRNLKTIKVD